MKLRSTLVIYRKEMKDILRDRRTLLSMVLIPILLMPLMMIGFGSFMQNRIESIKAKRSKIAWIGVGGASAIHDSLKAMSDVDFIELADTTAALPMLKAKDIDVVVLVPDGFDVQLGKLIDSDTSVKAPNIMVWSDQTREKSNFAAEKVTNVTEGFRADLVLKSLTNHGLRPEMVKPFTYQRLNIATKEDMSRFLAGSFLPYVIILMIMTGAMSPAIDLTAGEKERGTLETLLVSGVERSDIVLGKFLTVFSAAVVTATLSLTSMMVSFSLAAKSSSMIARELQFSLDFNGVLLMIMAMIPLAIILSSLLMTIALFAKSYREAQTYISPLMILVILPAMASLIPDTEISYRMAMIPILNVSLMLKQAMMGSVDITALIITMSVNIILAVVCFSLTLRMFRRESVLFRI
jgi:sodium transport system permease protein